MAAPWGDVLGDDETISGLFAGDEGIGDAPHKGGRGNSAIPQDGKANVRRQFTAFAAILLLQRHESELAPCLFVSARRKFAFSITRITSRMCWAPYRASLTGRAFNRETMLGEGLDQRGTILIVPGRLAWPAFHRGPSSSEV